MSDLKNLDHLADLAGIEPFYWDIWGNYYEVTEETKRSILWSLGIAASDDREIQASLVTLEEEPWRRCLPPVVVGRERQVVQIPVTLLAEAVRDEIKWTVIEEGGECREGLFQAADAPLLEARHIDGCPTERRLLQLSMALTPGYHTFGLPELNGGVSMPLIIAPQRCYLPSCLSEGRRQWGIGTQLYSLRSRTNWGMGDITDLGDLLEKAAALGAATVAINPLHALFPEDPELASPYMPSSQLHLNPLYLDVVLIRDLVDCEEARDLVNSGAFAAEVAEARDGDQVDYALVASLKGRVLELLYQSFRRVHMAGGGPRAGDFVRFQANGGRRLRHFAVFQALTEQFGHRRWMEWPEEYRDPGSEEVRLFTRSQRERVEFFQYLQWQTDLQLGVACERAREAGAPLGIYRDLAVSVSPDGADAWSEQRVVTLGGRIGAPPDPFNPLGQDWGSAPLHPHEMPKLGYQHFIEMLRANMRHAGALRIDHAMGLRRMFWIPAGATPESGAYVRYPFEDLLGILALESQRNRCVIVGEDLGTVPEGFRERMAEAAALSHRVFYFEKEGDRFRRPDEYPALALACASTHDLPTLRGFMEGNDLAQRFEHGLYRTEQARRTEGDERRHDRWLLLKALEAEGLLPPGVDPERPDEVAMTPALLDAVHLFMARSEACLFIAQIDDLFGEAEQVNLPGTSFERPNWRRKLSRDLESLAANPQISALAQGLEEARAAEGSDS